MNYTEKGTLILDGKLVAKEIQSNIKKRIEECNVEITLVTVLVGVDKPSQLYVNNKHKQATSSSIKSTISIPAITFPKTEYLPSSSGRDFNNI